MTSPQRHTGSWLAIAAAFAALMCSALPAEAGIKNTKHNLGTTNTRAGENRVTGDPNANPATGTDEVCVFCHTPHAASADATTAGVPLWNKALPNSTYTTYENIGSTTLDGKVLAVGSVSLACLSCHDGTQAMDNLVNAPGSGGWDTTGGGVNGLGYTWDTSTGRVTAEGKLSTASVANLGTDLQNDHPIGVQYCGGGYDTTTATGFPCKDTDFKQAAHDTINGKHVWWVDTEGTANNTRNKRDMILYTRAYNGVDQPFVECASCHDPHVDPTDTASVAGKTFLRVSNSGSGVCLSCHVK